jgi:3-hydroxyisobutyrate dehydrogenase
MKQVAFIGLGNMGGPMAKNLLAAGWSVAAFDLSQAALDDVTVAGAHGAKSAAEACESCDVVISMLPAGKHVKSVMMGSDGLFSRLPADTLVLDASTIDTADARELHTAAREHLIAFMDTPVSGGVAAAQAGTLAFMCGGASEAFARAVSVLEAMGNREKIFHAGGDGAGQVAKAANNMLLAIQMIGTCEALALGAANGLDPAIQSAIMKASSGNNWPLQVYNPWPGVMPTAPASNDYRPGFMVDLMAKDLGLATSLAEQSSVAATFGRQALSIYQALQADGLGLEDFSIVMKQFNGE